MLSSGLTAERDGSEFVGCMSHYILKFVTLILDARISLVEGHDFVLIIEMGD